MLISLMGFICLEVLAIVEIRDRLFLNKNKERFKQQFQNKNADI